MMPSEVDLDFLLTSHMPLHDLATVLLADADVDVDVDAIRDAARGEFYFFFAAGSGAGGIGAAQLPRFFQYINDNRSLDGVGPTEGGQTFNTGIASLVYPTLYEKDVSKILKKLPKAETIVAKGKSTGYFASKGYIVPQDYFQALEGCNPLAKRATFDALTRGSGDALSPIVFQESLEKYREGTDTFVSDLQAAALTKLSAFSALLFLLSGLAYVIIDDGIKAFL